MDSIPSSRFGSKIGNDNTTNNILLELDFDTIADIIVEADANDNELNSTVSQNIPALRIIIEELNISSNTIDTNDINNDIIIL